MEHPQSYGKTGLIEHKVVVAFLSSIPKQVQDTLANTNNGIVMAVEFLPLLSRLTVELGDLEAEIKIENILKGRIGTEFPNKYLSHLLDIVKTSTDIARKITEES